MKSNEINSFVGIIRQAKIYETLIVSLFVLPIYLGSWILILKQFDNTLWNHQLCILLILILIYIFGIIFFKYYQLREYKMEIAKDCISNYLLSKKWSIISFNRIRERINIKWSDEFLQSVIHRYNFEFRAAPIKGKKVGLRLLPTEEEQEDNNL